MAKVQVSPSVLEWARERAGVPSEVITERFKRYPKWLEGEDGPTFNQIEGLARFLNLPMGMLFLPEPPEEVLPLPDFRRMSDGATLRPSTELIDTIHTCQRRQTWYRNYLAGLGADVLGFVGSASEEDRPAVVAGQIRSILSLGIGSRAGFANWSAFLRHLIAQARKAGILVMVNGVVGNNTHRALNPREFRGFAISDSLAPLVFINGADTKAGQIFTMAHELAHVWLGKAGISNSAADDLPEDGAPDQNVERFCNAVAAEVLVPLSQLGTMELPEKIDAAKAELARAFRVSTLVALRRLKDLGRLSYEEFQEAYDEELHHLKELERRNRNSSTGGDFYATMDTRVDPQFALAVISTTLEGQTLVGDALEERLKNLAL